MLFKPITGNSPNLHLQMKTYVDTAFSQKLKIFPVPLPIFCYRRCQIGKAHCPETVLPLQVCCYKTDDYFCCKKNPGQSAIGGGGGR